MLLVLQVHCAISASEEPCFGWRLYYLPLTDLPLPRKKLTEKLFSAGRPAAGSFTEIMTDFEKHRKCTMKDPTELLLRRHE